MRDAGLQNLEKPMQSRYLMIWLGTVGALLSSGSGVAAQSEKIFLHKDWQLQSSCETKASGAEISTTGFNASGWHHTDVPSTVVGALVTDHTYPDPDYGTNFLSFPGFNRDRQ